MKMICLNCFAYEDPVEGTDDECPDCGYLQLKSTEELVDMANAYQQCQEELKETLIEQNLLDEEKEFYEEQGHYNRISE